MLGVVHAGGGVVRLSSKGIRILAAESTADLNSYRFANAADATVSRLACYLNTGTSVNSIRLEALPIADYDSVIWLNAESPVGEIAQVVLDAYQAADSYADVTCNISAASVSTISLAVDNGIKLQAHVTGVNVTGTLAVTGAITASTTITAAGDVQCDEVRTDGTNTDGTQRWQLGGRQPSADFAMTGYIEVWISGSKWVTRVRDGIGERARSYLTRARKVSPVKTFASGQADASPS